MKEEHTIQSKILHAVNAFTQIPFLEEPLRLIYWTCILSMFPLYITFMWLDYAWTVVNTFRTPSVPLILDTSKAVLITGCDSGFGNLTAKALAEKGLKVYAACLFEENAKVIEKEHENIIGIKMNVTSQSEIDIAINKISQENNGGLFCLINNAGIGGGCVFDWTPIEDYRKVMEVNYFGMMMVTKSCLPLLKTKKGRIVNITSASGLVDGLWGFGAYGASKHAADVFTSQIRHELEGWGIKVSTINPSFHKTAIVTSIDDLVQGYYNRLTPEMKENYGEKYLNKLKKYISLVAYGNMWDPKYVINTLIDATINPNPKPRYLVGIDVKTSIMTLQMLPDKYREFVYKTVSINKTKPDAMYKKDNKNKKKE